MRITPWFAALLALLVVPLPAGALFQAVEDGRVAALRDATWEDSQGNKQMGVNGSGILILSSEGYDGTHPDLQGCIDPERHPVIGAGSVSPDAPRNDLDSHGNLVAGVVCGSGSMSDGKVTGVAPGATLFAGPWTCVTFGDGCGLKPWFAQTDLRILTYSHTGSPVEWARSHGMPEGYDILMTTAVGNRGGDGTLARTDDLSDPRILGVAAGNGREAVANYSSRGAKSDPDTWPDLTAPGCLWSVSPPPWVEAQAVAAHSIVTDAAVENLTDGSISDCPPPPPPATMATLFASGYARAQGTSFAAPFVAGVGALMLEINPSLSRADLTYLLTRTADPFLLANDTNGDGEISPREFHEQHGFKAGWGYVNATAAVAAAHHQLLNPSSSLERSVRCSHAERIDGRLHLNPGEGPCTLPAERQDDPARDRPDRLDGDRANASQPEDNATGAERDGNASEDPELRQASGPPALEREASSSFLVGLLALCLSAWLRRRNA